MATAEEIKLELEEFISGLAPDVDLAPGSAVSELVVKLSASVQAQMRDEIAPLDAVGSVQEALDSEEDTQTETIDQIASNYNTYRGVGVKSAGKIRMSFDSDAPRTIPEGTIFNQPTLNLNFITTERFVASTTPGETGILLFESSPGVWSTIFSVEAELVGSGYQLADQTVLVPTTLFSGLVTTTAYGNFTSGVADETDKELIGRFRTGLSNKGLLSPQSILAKLRDEEGLVVDVSVVGANDAESKRANNTALGISSFGVADVYVRSTNGIETKTFTKTASFSGTSWTMSIDRDDAPGFYRIASIQRADQNTSGSLVVSSVVYSPSVSDLDRYNILPAPQDVRYSRYQSAVVEFSDTNSDGEEIGTEGATGEFEVTVSYQPGVDTIQDIFMIDTSRVACADYLVKAAIPCLVSVENLAIRPVFPDFDTTELKQAIFNYINGLTFGDTLYASNIIDICHNFDIKYVDLPLTLRGLISPPGGEETIELVSSDSLAIPNRPDLLVTPNTTTFFSELFVPDSEGVTAGNESISISLI